MKKGWLLFICLFCLVMCTSACAKTYSKGGFKYTLSGSHEDYEFPESLLERGVTEIEAGAFADWDTLISIQIPKGIVHIGDGAFSRCYQLQKIGLPGTLKSIGSYAFEGCTLQGKLALPKGLVSIGDGAFSENEFLDRVVLPDSVQELGIGVFNTLYSAPVIEIKNNEYALAWAQENDYPVDCPDAWTYRAVEGGWIIDKGFPIGESSLNKSWQKKPVIGIGSQAFAGLSHLDTVSVPEGIQFIGESAFENCSSMWKISFPKSLQVLGSNALRGCYSLRSVVIAQGLEQIEPGTFDGCEKLISVTIPSSVTAIPENAFADCPHVTIVAEEGSAAEAYALSHGLPVAREEQLWYMEVLEDGRLCLMDAVLRSGEVRIPDEWNGQKVQVIGEQAFINAKITKLTLPSALEEIRAYAFDGCILLDKLTLPSTIREIDNRAFDFCISLYTFILPDQVDESLSVLSNAYLYQFGVRKNTPTHQLMEEMEIEDYFFIR